MCNIFRFQSLFLNFQSRSVRMAKIPPIFRLNSKKSRFLRWKCRLADWLYDIQCINYSKLIPIRAVAENVLLTTQSRTRPIEKKITLKNMDILCWSSSSFVCTKNQDCAFWNECLYTTNRHVLLVFDVYRVFSRHRHWQISCFWIFIVFHFYTYICLTHAFVCEPFFFRLVEVVWL